MCVCMHIYICMHKYDYKYAYIHEVHKENCPGRPIVSTYECPTMYICKFLDIILSPLIQELPSFVNDIPQFLQINTI